MQQHDNMCGCHDALSTLLRYNWRGCLLGVVWEAFRVVGPALCTPTHENVSVLSEWYDGKHLLLCVYIPIPHGVISYEFGVA